MAKSTSASSKKDIEQGQACAALAYLFPIGLVWYLLDENMKKNPFAKFHIKQSLVAIIFVIAGSIASALFSIIGIGFILWIVVWVAALVWFIQGIVYSLSGREEELFLIGHLAKGLNI